MFGFWAPAASADPQDGPHADVRITITDQDVRFNMGLNLNFVDDVAPTRREMLDVVDPAEEQAIREKLLDFLTNQNSVEIDGVRVQPIVEKFELIRLERENLALFPRTGLRALTRFSVVLSYPFKTKPKEIRMTWTGYPVDSLAREKEQITGEPPTMVIQALIKAEGVVDRVYFSKSGPEYIWRPSGATIQDRLMTVPAPPTSGVIEIPTISAGVLLLWLVISGVLWKRRGLKPLLTLAVPAVLIALVTNGLGRVPIGAKPLTEEQALAIFQPLHANVYRAFDYSAESDVYDALAFSVAGPMLAELYTQIHHGLIQAENGGSVGRVTNVELTDAKVLDISPGSSSTPPGFDVDASWVVEGTVYHWGHSHARETAYHAIYRVEAVDGAWRIVKSDILSSERRNPNQMQLPPPGTSF
ncbi:MAG TPA: hypothetical protein ENJ00_01360 [Phycisphaerales bacterium]|nr:hypothetical protein [Phycisphaerales bacterium]